MNYYIKSTLLLLLMSCFGCFKFYKSDRNLDVFSNLVNITDADYPAFTFKGKTFQAKVVKILDGDTLDVCFNWKGDIIRWRCRCFGYDSAEMKPLLSNKNRLKIINKAKSDKERFSELLKDGLITIECGHFDKYGRILVEIYVHNQLKSINKIMVEEGHGVPYFGGKKMET